MSKSNIVKPVAMAVGVALAGSFAIGSVANADETPFAMSTMSVGYMMSDTEGSCGGDKKAEGDHAKDAEASCGGDADAKDAEASCGGDAGAKDAEASCGGDADAKDAEASCGGDAEAKDAEASCGGAT